MHIEGDGGAYGKACGRTCPAVLEQAGLIPLGCSETIGAASTSANKAVG